jgi:alkylation response protein AidB-like acyl-CoA dehydrogenase
LKGLGIGVTTARKKAMDFRFTAEEEKLRQEVVKFLEKEVTPEVVAEQKPYYRQYNQWGPLTSNIIGKMGERGWLVPHWPKKYGGLDMSSTATYMVHDELAYFYLPDIFMGSLWAGPTLMKEGSEELKDEFLLPLARGEIEFAVSYTEPEAGCDLANMQLRAVDKGDHFLLNGQKMFTSSARFSRYAWLAARTDWENPKKHQGISMFIVDLQSPGVSIRPMKTIGDWDNNEVFYDDVKLPKKYLVGQLNRGFYYMMVALDYERMYPVGWWRRIFDELVSYTREEKRNGKPLRNDAIIRQKLAQLAIELEVARLLYYQISYMLDTGGVPAYQASMEKLFTSELTQRLSNAGMQILGLYGQLKQTSKWAPLNGVIERHYRSTICETIAAGTSEIQRNIMAQRGLGLPFS